MAYNSGFVSDEEMPETLSGLFKSNVGDDTRITAARFNEIVINNRSNLPESVISKITNYIDNNKDGYVTLEEIEKMESEDAAVVAEGAGVSREHLSVFSRGYQTVGKFFLTKEQQKLTYGKQYKCCPPPIGILLISLAQIAVYVYYGQLSGNWFGISQEIVDSPIAYVPTKRKEAWRFLTYMFAHAGLEHVLFNVLVQVILAIPLEMVHGGLRIMGIYIGGVIAGSLASSVIDPYVILVGGSGGTYALLTAQIANVILNGDVMDKFYRVLRVTATIVLLLFDFGYSIYRRFQPQTAGVDVSFIAHVAGGVAGVTLGLVLLKNFKTSLADKIWFWISVVAYIAFIVFAVLWNIFYDNYPAQVV
ncbi:rhomboid-related protein 2-like [Ciona intestinalis]